MKVAVIGGAGYVGSLLCPILLAEGHRVLVYDACFFGDGFLPQENEHLEMVRGDIRNEVLLKQSLKGCDAVIMLACLSNDVCCQLDEEQSRDINILAFEPLVKAAKEAGVRRFIYCSSSSVYGISDADQVTEDHPLVPLTLYNTSKAACEKALWPHCSTDFECVVIRPATVCGYAPRMRFDLTVNIMTNHAVQKNAITVHGGKQRRPNLHIRDMCDVYSMLLRAPVEKILWQTFNVGQQNLAVKEIAEMIQRVVYQRFARLPTINTEPSLDIRSYHINSDKILRVLGWKPRHTVEQAIHDICTRFESGMWKDSLTNPWYVNVKQYVEEHKLGKAA